MHYTTTTPLSPTDRTRINRGKKRARADRADLYDVLDAGVICHLGVVVDGSPMVVPTAFGRVGDTLYLHGSTGARSLRSAGEVCVTVTVVDGLVLARSVFSHSMNYRSAMIYGRPRRVEDPAEREAALRAVTDHLVPGRWDHARRPTAKELAATLVLALPLEEASVKARSGDPGDEEDDYALPVWAGVLTTRPGFGAAVPDARLAEGIEVPEHVRAVLG